MYSEAFSDWPGRIVSLSVMVELVKSKARQNKSRREAIRGEIIGLIFVSGSTDCSLHMHVHQYTWCSWISCFGFRDCKFS
jgi:hypothetical protein